MFIGLFRFSAENVQKIQLKLQITTANTEFLINANVETVKKPTSELLKALNLVGELTGQCAGTKKKSFLNRVEKTT